MAVLRKKKKRRAANLQGCCYGNQNKTRLFVCVHRHHYGGRLGALDLFAFVSQKRETHATPIIQPCLLGEENQRSA